MTGSLLQEIGAILALGIAEPLPESRFREMALRAFQHQCRTNPVYAAFARGRGAEPGAVTEWTRVPPVPTAAFKELPLLSPLLDDETRGEPAHVFRTSGTSRGEGARGEHHVPDLNLYRASLWPSFQAHLLADGAWLPMLSLIPDAGEQPHSSLSYMVGAVAEKLQDEGSRTHHFVDARGDLRCDALNAALSEASDAGEPVLLVGTAFAFVHWMDLCEERGWRHELPAGSRIMETGGFKGRSRTVRRSELYGALARRLGVPPRWIVNEYGMTELLSQFYDHVAGEPGEEPEERWHRPPPWVRTRVLDPETLDALEDGAPGLLCHFDLANLGSVCHVLTEDMGVARGGRFRLLGRSPGAEPRGCSLAMDELLSASRGERR